MRRLRRRERSSTVTYEEKIGGNIREVRLQKRYSQEKLAGLCGISNTTLSAYENSKKIPNLTTVAKIAKVTRRAF